MNERQELKQLADECYNESLTHLYEGKLKNAEETANRARELYNQIEDKHREALTLNLLSIIYDELGNASMDLTSLLDALEIALDDNAYDISAKIFNNLGSKLMYAKAYERALYYFTRALEEFDKAEKAGLNREEDIHPFIIVLNMNLATICCYTGNLEKARIHYEIAKTESTHPLNREFAFTFQAFEGHTLWKLGEHEKAAGLVDSIMHTALTSEYTTDYMEVISDFIDLLKEMKDYERWHKVLTIMDNHLNEDGGLYVNIEMLKRWLEYYDAINDVENYKDCCLKYYLLSKEKDELEYSQRADTIELNTEMRRTIRQKQHTDSIVYLDPLTGIGNRNRMLEDSKKYIADAISEKNTIAIGLIDVDFFKECNDTYGHIEGDGCLKAVAKVIEDAVGDNGRVYRYGGDEFLVLLPKVDDDGLNELGETIKNNLSKAQIPNEKSPISPYVTVSQGYTRAYPEEGDEIDHLVELADKVLYAVKRYGRNNYKYMLYQDIL